MLLLPLAHRSKPVLNTDRPLCGRIEPRRQADPCDAAALAARSATDSSKEIDSFFTATNLPVALRSDPTDFGVTPAR